MDPTQADSTELQYVPEMVDDQVHSRKPRKDCFLSVGERKAIEPFKERYKSEPIRERRVTMVKSEVMVAYFNYLHSQKKSPKTPEELKQKTQVRDLKIPKFDQPEYILQFLSGWIANNWRPSASKDTGMVNMNMRLIDLVWRKKHAECEAELKEMLDVDDLDRSSSAYFSQRLVAAKWVTDGLDSKEKEALEAELREIKQRGHDKEVQQQYVFYKIG